MDEHGIPKYRGRKRGRKPRPRKRKSNPDRPKRKHTAYTLFVQEQHPLIRAQHPTWLSKQILSVVAKQWADVPAEEKKMWKERALATHVVDGDEVAVGAQEDDDEEDDDEEEVEEDKVQAAARMRLDDTEDYEPEEGMQAAGQEGDDDNEEEAAPPARHRTRRA